jgi:hypothetical protein
LARGENASYVRDNLSYRDGVPDLPAGHKQGGTDA